MLFAGNLIKHPCFDDMRRSGQGFRVVSGGPAASGSPAAQPPSRPAILPVTDRIMNGTFWIGVYPGMTREMLVYIVKSFSDFLENI
jgi:CDP-6-deoxy-D-xylo-4-hexulose-3-dehydrase